jgi:uroporphyrinogen-III decarboxylase
MDPIGFDPSAEFSVRKKRLDDAMALKKPDRVPVVPLVVHYYATRSVGITNKTAGYDLNVYARSLKAATLRHRWDAAVDMRAMQPSEPLDILGIRQIKWPGGALDDDQPFQWEENEYLRADEYDEMLHDPNGFALKKIWPRISATLAPISDMLQMPPMPLLYLSNAYTLPEVLGEMISGPDMDVLLEKALALARVHRKNATIKHRYVGEMMNLGYPFPFQTVTVPAFDWISDTLRGLRGTSLDMYRNPDKLLAFIEMFTPLTVGASITMAEKTGNKGVFIPMHRGADGFMSEEQFAKFYWPCLKQLFLGLIEAGLTPIPLIEGKYTSRLEFFKELPPGKVVGHFDQVDRKKAKAAIGDVMCFWGNVPASLMCTGTPQQVEDDVKALIDIFADTGGLIIDSNMGIPDESRLDNVQALTEAVHKHGVY